MSTNTWIRQICLILNIHIILTFYVNINTHTHTHTRKKRKRKEKKERCVNFIPNFFPFETPSVIGFNWFWRKISYVSQVISTKLSWTFSSFPKLTSGNDFIFTEMMMMSCFYGMVDRRKAFSLISSCDHCPRSSTIANLRHAAKLSC